MNNNLDLINHHISFMNIKSKYIWICSKCIKKHGKNCTAIFQNNNIKIMKKLVKAHCDDEGHIDADPEYISTKEEYLRDNKN